MSKSNGVDRRTLLKSSVGMLGGALLGGRLKADPKPPRIERSPTSTVFIAAMIPPHGPKWN